MTDRDDKIRAVVAAFDKWDRMVGDDFASFAEVREAIDALREPPEIVVRHGYPWLAVRGEPKKGDRILRDNYGEAVVYASHDFTGSEYPILTPAVDVGALVRAMRTIKKSTNDGFARAVAREALRDVPEGIGENDDA